MLEKKGEKSNCQHSCLTNRFEPDTRKTRAAHPER